MGLSVSSRKVGDVFVERSLDQRREFFCPIFHQRHFLARHTEEIDQRIDVLDKCGTQIAHPCAWLQLELVGETATQNKALAAENSAGGIEVEIVRHHIARALIMIGLQRVGGDGYVFAFAIGSARRLGKVEAFATPQHIRLARNHTHDLGAQVLVAIQRHRGGKLTISAHFRKVVFAAKFGERRTLDEFHQLTLLHGIGIVGVAQLVIEPRQKTLLC